MIGPSVKSRQLAALLDLTQEVVRVGEGVFNTQDLLAMLKARLNERIPVFYSLEFLE